MSDPKALMKEGEDALKTSLFKWEADHLAAGMLFEQAGKAYRARGDGESALGAYLKAAKSHLSKGGKGYEAAAAAYQAAAQAYPPKAAELYTKSVELYTGNGNAEEAVEVMGKAADNFEKNGETEAAINLYIKGVDMANVDEFTRAIVTQKLWTFLTKAFQKLIAARRLAEASKCANKMLQIQKVRGDKSPKMILQIVIVYLARGDIGAARQLVNANVEDANFIRSSEGDCAQDLIDAYERLDSDRIKKLVEGNTIKYLDTQVVYLARELSPTTAKMTAPAQPVAAKTTASSSDKAALFSTSTKASSTAASKAPIEPIAAVKSVEPRQPAQQTAVQPPKVEEQPTFDLDLPDLR